MNIFRFIADMLHLAAICILLYRIRKSRNCIGKPNSSKFNINLYRSFMQDIGTILDSILFKVHGLVHVFHLTL